MRINHSSVGFVCFSAVGKMTVTAFKSANRLAARSRASFRSLTAALLIVIVFATMVMPLRAMTPKLSASFQSLLFSPGGSAARTTNPINAAPPVPFLLSTTASTPGLATTIFNFANASFAALFAGNAAIAENSVAESNNAGNLPLPGTAANSSAVAVLDEPEMPLCSSAGARTAFDYDGDGCADISRFKSDSFEWRVRASASGTISNTVHGGAGVRIAPADYDGDGTTDFAVFHAPSGGWGIKKSLDGTVINPVLGQAGDRPVSADYDGDEKADPAVYRASNNTFYYLKSSDNYAPASQQWGMSGDVPVAGDFDGDGKADFAVWRASNGTWYVIPSATGGFVGINWGVASDVPVPADYNGDGTTDYAVFRRETGQWFVINSNGQPAATSTTAWGNYGDQPVPADYNGDGKADCAVWRPATGVWYIAHSTGGTYSQSQMGANGDAPTPAAYLKSIAAEVVPSILNRARLSPKNATGGSNLYSRNSSWGTGLLGLPGRAGMDLNLGLSYNSLVWTKIPAANGNSDAVVFDADGAGGGGLTPGFRTGFPTIEDAYFDSETFRFAYLLVDSNGGRTELKQLVGASGEYESVDSSYLHLTVESPGGANTLAENRVLKLRSTDGTMMKFTWRGGQYRAAEIKDRNGNFITINHDEYGVLRSIVDTLGRTINFNYYAPNTPDAFLLQSITQQWETGTHTWATFVYGTKTISPNFDPNLIIIGPGGNTQLRMLERVNFPDGGSYRFEYNKYGQVWQVGQFAADAPDHKLNHVAVNLSNLDLNDLEQHPAMQVDAPRFTKTKTWAENFNLSTGSNSQPQEVVSSNSYQENHPTPGISQPVTLVTTTSADGVVSKSWAMGSGSYEAMSFRGETWAMNADLSALEIKRWTSATYAQDDPTLGYMLNPRVTSSIVSDAGSSRKTEIDYYAVAPNSNVSQFGLVREVRLLDNVATPQLLRKSTSEYNLSPAYLSRRIIGLPAENKSFDGAGNLTGKTTYMFDADDFTGAEQTVAASRHDAANYGASFVTGRGNLTSSTSWNVDFPNDSSQAVTSSVKYNTTGAVIAQISPGAGANTTRTVKISYADQFEGNFKPVNPTFAYPTTLTDPADNSSTAKYRFDIGANVRAQSPVPAGQSSGKVTTRSYDDYGRLTQESLLKNNVVAAYQKYLYSPAQNQFETRATVTDVNNNGAVDAGDETASVTYLDGAGRTRAARSEHPGSTGGWSGQLIEYDLLGRVKRQSAPTEINANFGLAGDGAVRGWLWTGAEYDWKGRVVKENKLGGTDTLVSYEGCGCAGGQITTVKGAAVAEGRRTSKSYADKLGRTWKTETLNWDGSVYSSTVIKFNGRDQAVWTKQFKGAAPLNALETDLCSPPLEGGEQTCQMTSATYDGHGRVKTQHAPQQEDGKNTSFNYNPDGSLQSATDARGATSTYLYNNRGLVEKITRSLPFVSQPRPLALCDDAGEDDSCLTVNQTNNSTHPTIGYLDWVDSASRKVTGWARDMDSPGTSINVHLYIDAPSGSGNHTAFYNVVANRERTDVNPSSNHGFEFELPATLADGKPHTVYAYGIDVVGGNTNSLLGNSPRPFLLTPPQTETLFEYDNLGNRTKMTDETGVTTFEYDGLSRVTKENKHLRDNWTLPRHDFSIDYEYNFAGQLKKITDPFGQQIDYKTDKTGRMTGISGSPFTVQTGAGTQAVTDYITDIDYTAWGAIGATDYGNQQKMTQTFDNRLRVSEFKVWKETTGSDGITLKKNYEYYNDDLLKFSADASDPLFRGNSHDFDRSYQYDAQGRVTKGYSGMEARGESGTPDRNHIPYKHEYSYNAFGDVTARNVTNWTENKEQTHVWHNHRESTRIYDADGKPLSSPDSSFSFDAAGQTVMSAHHDRKMLLQQTDGTGNAVRRDDYKYTGFPKRYDLSETFYQIHSSVLGKLLVELDVSGRKKRGFVHGSEGLVATQNVTSYDGSSGTVTAAHVGWQHFDPSGASFASTTADSYIIRNGEENQAELTPMGENVGTSNPFSTPGTNNVGGPGGGFGYPFFGDAFGGPSCYIDFVLQSGCGGAYRMLASNIGFIGPLSQTEQVRNPRTGEIGLGVFQCPPNGGACGYYYYSNYDTFDPDTGERYPNAGMEIWYHPADTYGGPFYFHFNEFRDREPIIDAGTDIAATPSSTNPCAGHTLNYNAGGNTGWTHIVPRHIDQTPRWSRQNKSVYGRGYISTPNLEARKSRVAILNNLTFNYGGATVQTDPNTGNKSYVYVLAMAAGVSNLFQIFVVGMDGSSAHRGQWTNVNTLVVGSDCQTVITSHPGLPSPRLTPNPNITGTPQWWTPSLVLPF